MTPPSYIHLVDDGGQGGELAVGAVLYLSRFAAVPLTGRDRHHLRFAHAAPFARAGAGAVLTTCLFSFAPRSSKI
jgi:hypothetical protein